MPIPGDFYSSGIYGWYCHNTELACAMLKQKLFVRAVIGLWTGELFSTQVFWFLNGVKFQALVGTKVTLLPKKQTPPSYLCRNSCNIVYVTKIKERKKIKFSDNTKLMISTSYLLGKIYFHSLKEIEKIKTTNIWFFFQLFLQIS